MAATLEQESARSQRYSRPLSFLLVEIDESALEYAPNLLQDLRSALSGVLRDTDTLGHWGPAPTRFAIILPETPPAGAANILSRLQTVPLISGHLHLGLSGTLGTTTTPLDLPALAEASLLATAS
jgi:GGDEF domain-containing protein